MRLQEKIKIGLFVMIVNGSSRAKHQHHPIVPVCFVMASCGHFGSRTWFEAWVISWIMAVADEIAGKWEISRA